MNVLDENVRDDQRALLWQWRIPFRQIGKEISRAGIQDPDLIPLLHRLKRPTLFTQDHDLFKRGLCNRAYCLAWLNVSNVEAGEYIRRFLKHPAFDTQAKRLGIVARVHRDGVTFWRTGDRQRVLVPWE